MKDASERGKHFHLVDMAVSNSATQEPATTSSKQPRQGVRKGPGTWTEDGPHSSFFYGTLHHHHSSPDHAHDSTGPSLCLCHPWLHLCLLLALGLLFALQFARGRQRHDFSRLIAQLKEVPVKHHASESLRTTNATNPTTLHCVNVKQKCEALHLPGCAAPMTHLLCRQPCCFCCLFSGFFRAF